MAIVIIKLKRKSNNKITITNHPISKEFFILFGKMIPSSFPFKFTIIKKKKFKCFWQFYNLNFTFIKSFIKRSKITVKNTKNSFIAAIKQTAIDLKGLIWKE